MILHSPTLETCHGKTRYTFLNLFLMNDSLGIIFKPLPLTPLQVSQTRTGLGFHKSSISVLKAPPPMLLLALSTLGTVIQDYARSTVLVIPAIGKMRQDCYKFEASYSGLLFQDWSQIPLLWKVVLDLSCCSLEENFQPSVYLAPYISDTVV